ncbi:Cobalamin B12-binding domain protein [Desulfosarcina cetonica]|nr:Cobalamin B12-binding domain protein [Desulfosarcina cetonica]
MVDILLIQPPMADYYQTAKRTLPYGLACMAAAARTKGFSVAILDAMATRKSRIITLPPALDHLLPFYGRADVSPMALFHDFRHFGYSLEHVGRQIKSSGAFLVGVSSLFTAYSHMALAVARTVKASLPGCTVVLGGHHPTALPEAVLAEPAVDLVIRGEGEEALPLLAEAICSGTSIEDVPGIGLRRPDGTLLLRAPARVRELDRMPAPAYDLVNRKFYQRHGRDSLVVTAGRGCPLACSYCSTGATSWMGFRKRAVASVLAEIRTASVGRRVGFIDFEDENLTMDRGWFLDLMAGMSEIFGDAPPELRAMNGLFPPSIDESIVQAMKIGGFTALNLSLGSADRDQLRRFRRPDVRKAFDRALQLGCREGLPAVGYIIVGAPDQDPLTSVDDLLFLARRPVLAGVSVFYPAPGSRDYQRCLDSGLLPETFGAMRATALPIDQRTSRTDSATLLRLGRMLNFIKARFADGLPLPRPAAVPAHIDPATDRRRVGTTLLAGFLDDGVIRGIDREGRVYRHHASAPLCRRFLDGLRAAPVSGF